MLPVLCMCVDGTGGLRRRQGRQMMMDKEEWVLLVDHVPVKYEAPLTPDDEILFKVASMVSFTWA